MVRATTVTAVVRRSQVALSARVGKCTLLAVVAGLPRVFVVTARGEFRSATRSRDDENWVSWAAGLAGMRWEQALDYCQEVGLDAIELPVGCFPGAPWWDPAAVLKSKAEQKRIIADCQARGLEIIGLAVHGNAVHPDRRIATSAEKAHDIAVRLAPRLGTNVVITFAGCPGGSLRDKTPNWVTCPWPDDFGAILGYQWDEVLIPFWTKKNALAKKEGVRIAFEAHPGFCVYNTETLLKLRQACGKQLGANLDPSHFFWQGMDPVEAARAWGDAKCIFHVHGKDTGDRPAQHKHQRHVLDTPRATPTLGAIGAGSSAHAAMATATNSGSRLSAC